MPTVEEVDFEEEEYDTEDEEDEEEFSLVDKVSDSVSAALGGLKRYATPVWKYGGPILGYFDNFVACGASFDDGSSERTSNGTRNAKARTCCAKPRPFW